MHEARKAGEVSGGPANHLGFVESIVVNSAPSSGLAGREFDLGIRNIITGPNESGKSVLTRLLASVAHPDHLAEISHHRDVDIAVRWFDPNPRIVATKGRSGDVTHVLDGEAVPYVPRPYKTILLDPTCSGVVDDVVSIAQLFDLSISGTRATLEQIPAHSALITGVRYENTTVHWTLEMNGRKFESAGADTLSPGLCYAILLELSAFHARTHARVEPTILLIDEILDFSHTKQQVDAFERLLRSAEHTQIAIVTHSPAILAAASDWNVTELEHHPPSSPHSPFDIEIGTTAEP